MYVVWSDDSWLDTERFRKQKEGEEPDEVILFMCNHSFYDENAAPPGKQVLVSGTVCSPNPEAEEIEGLWRCMDRQMQELLPEIWEATERKEYNGPRDISNLTRDSVLPGQGGECVGLAQIVGQCGSMKPIGRRPRSGACSSPVPTPAPPAWAPIRRHCRASRWPARCSTASTRCTRPSSAGTPVRTADALVPPQPLTSCDVGILPVWGRRRSR